MKKPFGLSLQEFIRRFYESGHDMFYDGEVDDGHGEHGCCGEDCTVPWHQKAKGSPDSSEASAKIPLDPSKDSPA